MSHQTLLESLLLLTDRVTPATVDCEGILLKISMSDAVRCFSLNIILVLEGARLAYRSDIPGLANEELLSYVNMMAPELSIAPPVGPNIVSLRCEEEPLVMRTDRLDEAEKIIRTVLPHQDILGRLLEFSYYGRDWHSNKPRYTIYLEAVRIGLSDEEEEVTMLFTFKVFVEVYNAPMRAHIEATRERLENTLINYGYLCRVSYMDHTVDATPVIDGLLPPL